LFIFGASGNTGMIAVHLGKRMGSRVLAVSSKKWIKDEYGADYLITDYNHIIDKVKG
jgi:NADPH:quinone reductase-like Zn-dependent oxidoreductase